MNCYKLTLLLALSSAIPVTATAQDTTKTDVQPIVIIGASYAASWPIETLAGRAVVNNGLAGNQSFEMSSRFLEDVVALEPDTVIIWGFINDIFRSDADELEDAKDRIKRSYEEMLAMAEDHEIEVVLATEISVREPKGALNWAAGVVGRIFGKTSYQDMINGHVHEVNLWIKDYAELEGITVLEFEALLTDSDGKRKDEFAADDGSHLTSAAYEAMSAYTKDVLHVEYSANEVK